MESLPSMPAFPVHSDPTTTSTRWKKYLSRVENAFIAFNITDDKRQRALLLHWAGEEVSEIFDTLPETGTDFETAKSQLTSYFSLKKNMEYERFVFRDTMQNSGESIDAYHTRLQRLANTCDFTNKDQEVKSQIIRGCTLARLRRRALREETTLENLLSIARSFEVSEVQASGMEEKSTKNTVTDTATMLPSKGKTKKSEKGENVKAVYTQVESPEDEYCFTVQQTNGNRPRVMIHIGETEVASLIDTGSTVNIMSMDTYNTLNNKPKLQRDNSSNVYAYCSSKPLNINSSFQAQIKYKLHDTEAKFLVTDKPADTLLDYNTASKLGLVYIANQISPGTSRCDRIVAEYEDLGFMALVS
ncbi:uncharacterized protein [Ptychodera flava]|uniref:uncharacterized protein n=1 Tax=Ptychodera flava TaxID=63121 RepID=UPI00396A5F9F